MGEMKRAQELRVDEFSVQKLRESHDTIQRLTSQIHRVAREGELHLSDTGEFQEVESNNSGKTFHVPMLSRDKRLPLDTWNLSGSQENVFWQSTFYVRVITNTLSRNSSLYDTICYRCDSSACLYRDTCCKRWRTNWEHNTNADIAGRPSTINSLLPVDIPQNSMAGQQILQISELQFDKFSPHSTFSFWKMSFKNQVTTCSDFPWTEAMLWINQRSGDGRISGRIKILVINCRQ